MFTMDTEIIFSWNIRGINNSIAHRNFTDIVRRNRANIFCLQETKCGDNSLKWLKSLSVKGQFGLSSQPSEGLSDGLITGWDLRRFKCVGLAQSKHWIWNCLMEL